MTTLPLRRILSINTSILHVLVVLLFFTSCSEFKKIQKSEDWRQKYEAAIRYYEKKDYHRSTILFENIAPIVRGLPEGEMVQYYMAYCQYYERTFLLASNSFRTFYETYGRSNYVVEALYMHAYSLFESAPPYNNDQEGTIKAMDAMQGFLNRYPSSEYSEKAAEVIEICHEKLERKGFENAKLYLRLEYYNAATITLRNFHNKYPDSKYVEEADYLRVKSQYLYAKSSVSYKQKERYESALEMYNDFLERYPESIFLTTLQPYYTLCVEALHKTKIKNS